MIENVSIVTVLNPTFVTLQKRCNGLRFDPKIKKPFETSTFTLGINDSRDDEIATQTAIAVKIAPAHYPMAPTASQFINAKINICLYNFHRQINIQPHRLNLIIFLRCPTLINFQITSYVL